MEKEDSDQHCSYCSYPRPYRISNSNNILWCDYAFLDIIMHLLSR